MAQVDGTFGVDFLFHISCCLGDTKGCGGVCPDCTGNKSLDKARSCVPVRWLMGASSSQELPLGHGASALPTSSNVSLL